MFQTHKVDERFATSTSRDLVRCKNFFTCIENIVKREGFRGLFQGWLVTVLKSQLTSIVAFTTYECLCYVVREFNKTVVWLFLDIFGFYHISIYGLMLMSSIMLYLKYSLFMKKLINKYLNNRNFADFFIKWLFFGRLSWTVHNDL